MICEGDAPWPDDLRSLTPEEIRKLARDACERAERSRAQIRLLLELVAEDPPAFGCVSAREFAEKHLRMGPDELEEPG